MKISSTKFGISVSVIYTLFISWITYGRWNSLSAMPLNEFGDFFAGLFGPLAIFWLILGYFQQGKELSLNTEALKLQAKELQNSVHQQKELVEITQKQHDLAQKARDSEEKRNSALQKPKFVVVSTKWNAAGGVRSEEIILKNEGATVTAVEVAPDDNVDWFKPEDISSIVAEEIIQIKFGLKMRAKAPDSANIDLKFADSSGAKGEVTILWSSENNGARVSSRIIELES